MSTTINNKLSTIRKELRREHLHQLFSTKRIPLLSPSASPSQSPSQSPSSQLTLLECLTTLKEYHPTHSPSLTPILTTLIHLLASKTPFNNYSTFLPSESIINKFCIELTETILLHIFPTYNTDNQSDKDNRINCINIVLNLLAEECCPNALLAETILTRITSTYDSVELWGIDEEIVELGWLLSNLIRKNIITHLSEKTIAKLLSWLEELLNLSDEDMRTSLYRGLSILWYNIDLHYNRNHPLIIPEHFKAERINILEKTIKISMRVDQPPRCILPILIFLKEQIECVMICCGEEYVLMMIDNCAKILGTISRKTQNANCELLCKCLKTYHENDEPHLDPDWSLTRYNSKTDKCRTYLLQHHTNTLLINLAMQELYTKQCILTIILQLLQPEPGSSLQTLNIVEHLSKASLEDVMITICRSEDEGIVIECCQIVHVMATVSEWKCGRRFVQELETWAIKSSKAGEIACEIIEESERHMQEINMR